MLRRFAEETTVHGIKEAFFASWVGRVFWVLVFLGGVAAMVFQLETIFVGYTKGLVGTKTTSTVDVDEIEVPSFYYCHRHWLPFPKEYEKLSYCLPPKKFDDDTFYENCYRDFAYAILTEEAINGIFLEGKDEVLPDEVAVDSLSMRRSLKGIFDRIMAVYDEIETKFSGDIAAYVQSKTIGKRVNRWEFTDDEGGRRLAKKYNLTMLAHGVITKYKELVDREFADQTSKLSLDRVQHLSGAFDRREGTVSINQNGVCWEIRPEERVGKPWKVSTVVYDHYVVHLGGYIYTLNPIFVRRGLFDYDNLDMMNNYRGYGYQPFIHKFPGYTGSITFNTDLFIGPQRQELPFFGDGLKLTGEVQNVMVKFWTKKIIHLNRKSYRCSKDWSPMDVAHCNQEQKLKQITELTATAWNSSEARDLWKYGCKVYLPASRYYAATPLNETCKAANIRDTSRSIYQWMDGNTAFNNGPDQRFMKELLNAGWLGQSPSALEAKAFVQDQHPDCPLTCLDVDYKFEVSYPKEPTNEYRQACKPAVDLILRSSTFTTDEERYDMFMRTLRSGWRSEWKDNTGIDLPCTHVTLIQNEIGHGTIIEEYPLYSFADLLSNIGGTIGLWIGASVISFIQCIYLFCLERLLTKRENVEVAPDGTQGQEDEQEVTEKKNDTAVSKRQVEVAQEGSQGQDFGRGVGMTGKKKDTKVYPEDEVIQMLNKSESYARRYDRY